MTSYHMLCPITTFPTKLLHILQVCTLNYKDKFLQKSGKQKMFKFLRGVFQGDPFSGIIFLIAFNPIVQYIKKNMKKHMDIH